MLQLILETAGENIKLDIKDVDGDTPVFVAATGKSPEVLRKLLQAGANPNPLASDGWSALMMAVRDSSPEMVEILLQAGADVEGPTDMFGRGVLQMIDMLPMVLRGGESPEEARNKANAKRELLLQYM